eukprot:3797141-Alexandrium_andersonii.AAC.1
MRQEASPLTIAPRLCEGLSAPSRGPRGARPCAPGDACQHCASWALARAGAPALLLRQPLPARASSASPAASSAVVA